MIPYWGDLGSVRGVARRSAIRLDKIDAVVVWEMPS